VAILALAGTRLDARLRCYVERVLRGVCSTVFQFIQRMSKNTTTFWPKSQRGDQIKLTSIELQAVAYRKLVTDTLVFDTQVINSDRDARDAVSEDQIWLNNTHKRSRKNQAASLSISLRPQLVPHNNLSRSISLSVIFPRLLSEALEPPGLLLFLPA
jgi:hypothetical protein